MINNNNNYGLPLLLYMSGTPFPNPSEIRPFRQCFLDVSFRTSGEN